MATKGDDKESEKTKGALIDANNLEDDAKEVNKECDSEEMLTSILAKQNDMSGDIKSLITTVAGVQRDVETLKPLVDMVDDLKEMEQRLTAVETNTNKNEMLD